jgi:lipoate-protein ligase A
VNHLDLTLPTLFDNLALDEALLLEAESCGASVLRTWEWPKWAVVLGAGGKLTEEVHEEICREDHVELARRSSGGGTVLLGTGCLLYSLILPYEHHPALKDVKASYCYILGELAAALAGLIAPIAPAGISDLATAGRKFSGNSQQRKRTHLLHHGSLLYDFDLDRVTRYLKEPSRQPDYRQGRGHRAFLMNLPATAPELTRRLRERWRAVDALQHWPQEKCRELVESKYGQEEWTRRR